MIEPPERIYDLLIDAVPTAACADEVLIGLTWTLCRTAGGIGLAMSPGTATRTLAWPGTLAGRRLAELAPWVRAWDPFEATVGMAAINAALNPGAVLAATAVGLTPGPAANLAVFHHFADQLAGRRVAVIGRYPGLDALELGWDLTVIERNPGAGDLPDPAAEFCLPAADWVFLTATSLINKTFPRLAELSRAATLVLMGPTVPWLGELRDWGVDYLAGVRVTDPQGLRQTIAEGGGTRIFAAGVEYAVADLRPAGG
ncbi:DUF364 domain-containing protein [uncultured Thiodictyon sp.]|uniref:DUF364 domain-containing protein n=1 Tax=uncultured Thiodictyon sp. TaxID=1846217 RepID=UPI0025F37019|nr:DUF364 domain-containing protein [uncultured Thiodictyon sp.]